MDAALFGVMINNLRLINYRQYYINRRMDTMSTIMKDLKLSPLFQRNMMTYIVGIMLTQL